MNGYRDGRCAEGDGCCVGCYSGIRITVSISVSKIVGREKERIAL